MTATTPPIVIFYYYESQWVPLTVWLPIFQSSICLLLCSEKERNYQSSVFNV